MLKKEYPMLEELIEKEIDNKEDRVTLDLIKKLENVKKRGYLEKDEFFNVCMWKSARNKQRYKNNSEEGIRSISKEVLSTTYEKRKIELLTKLHGVDIPTASAILTLIDPENYGVIDIRVWQVLWLYGSVKVKPDGRSFTFKNWYNYLQKLRYYSKKLKVSVRDIERTLFLHHKRIQEGNLYT